MAEKKKKGDIVIMSTPSTEAEAQKTIEALRKLKPDLPVQRTTVCYDMDGTCVCDVVNSGLVPDHIAQLFQQGKIRVLQGRGGPPVDAKLYELIKRMFTEKAKQTP